MSTADLIQPGVSQSYRSGPPRTWLNCRHTEFEFGLRQTGRDAFAVVRAWAGSLRRNPAFRLRWPMTSYLIGAQAITACPCRWSAENPAFQLFRWNICANSDTVTSP